MKECYITVLKDGRAEITEKKSRFIAHVKNVVSEQEAVEYIDNIKKTYWDAKHNVYAYYVRGDSAAQKSSDDGEPAGTAGIPILEVIKKAGIEDIVIVVTRYFGGTLLGTGGLIRAYSKCAKEGIISAGVGEKILCSNLNFKIDYTLISKLQSLAVQNGYKAIHMDYTDMVNMYVAVPVNDVEKFRKQVCELSSGEVRVNEIDRGYYITKKLNKEASE